MSAISQRIESVSNEGKYVRTETCSEIVYSIETILIPSSPHCNVAQKTGNGHFSPNFWWMRATWKLPANNNNNVVLWSFSSLFSHKRARFSVTGKNPTNSWFKTMITRKVLESSESFFSLWEIRFSCQRSANSLYLKLRKFLSFVGNSIVHQMSVNTLPS